MTDVETQSTLRQTFKADPLTIVRTVTNENGTVNDTVQVMLNGVSVARTAGWPGASAAELRKMADACTAAADAMDPWS